MVPRVVKMHVTCKTRTYTKMLSRSTVCLYTGPPDQAYRAVCFAPSQWLYVWDPFAWAGRCCCMPRHDCQDVYSAGNIWSSCFSWRRFDCSPSTHRLPGRMCRCASALVGAALQKRDSGWLHDCICFPKLSVLLSCDWMKLLIFPM